MTLVSKERKYWRSSVFQPWSIGRTGNLWPEIGVKMPHSHQKVTCFKKAPCPKEKLKTFAGKKNIFQPLIKSKVHPAFLKRYRDLLNDVDIHVLGMVFSSQKILTTNVSTSWWATNFFWVGGTSPQRIAEPRNWNGWIFLGDSNRFRRFLFSIS